LVSRPEVIYRKDKDGNLQEPIEKLFLEIPKDAMGDVMQNLAGRKGEITNMNHHGDEVSIEAMIPTRGLIGFETDLVNQTRGLGVMSHLFHEYGPDRGDIAARKNGSLVSMEDGEAMAYALNMVQERGRLMVEPGDKIYAGMIVGELVGSCLRMGRYGSRERDRDPLPGLGEQPLQCTCRIAYQGGVYCQIANSGARKLEFKIAEHTLTNRDQRACSRLLRLGQCGNFAQSIVLKFHVNAKSFEGSPILPDHATFRSFQNRKVVIGIELLTDYAYRKPSDKFRL